MKTKPRLLTVAKYEGHPRIILQGLWLEQCGFKPGDKVEVSLIEPGQLMIKTAPQNAPAIINEPDAQQKQFKALQTAEPKAGYYHSLYPRPSYNVPL